MAFDLFAQQQLVAERLAALIAAAAIELQDTFGFVNLADDSAPAIAAQTVFLRFIPRDETGRSALHDAVWSLDVYVDTGRASAAQKSAAAALFSGALAALVGWEFEPGRFIRTASGQPTGFEGHITRISFGFSIPVYLAG